MFPIKKMYDFMSIMYAWVVLVKHIDNLQRVTYVEQVDIYIIRKSLGKKDQIIENFLDMNFTKIYVITYVERKVFN